MKPFIAALLLFSAGQLRAAEITVFAAASLTDALKEIGAAYEKTSGDTVRFNFAASNVLAQQIQAGAPADIFFSADAAKMDALEKEALIAEETRRDLLGNSLVIITPDDAPTVDHAKDLTASRIRYLSLGDPKAVPAGIYAKAYLEKQGLWTELAKKVAPAESGRAAVAVVAAGNAEAGIVYRTDAEISKNVRIALDIPVAEGPKIIYPVALLKDSREAKSARKFLLHLAADEADATFRRFGFSVLD